MIKKAFIVNKLQLPNHSLNFIEKNETLSSDDSILSCSPMAYNTTAFLDKLTCTDDVDFGKCQDTSGQFPWSKKDSNFLEVKLKDPRRDDNKDCRLVQTNTMGVQI